jgi:hypothetical protein
MFNMTFLIFYGSHRHVWRGFGAPAIDDKVHILELCCREKVSVCAQRRAALTISLASATAAA